MLCLLGLDKSQRVTLGATAEGVELTPEEYFVLSRVQGTPTIGEILATSGLAAGDAARILDKLLNVGAVVTTDAVPKAPSRPRRPNVQPGSKEELRRKAADRRKRMLAAQFGAKPNPAARVSAAGQAPLQQDEDKEDEGPEYEKLDRPLAKEKDSRIDTTLGLSVDDQRFILGLADAAEDLSQFEFLGLAPTHDLGAIKRAFHETSRRLHPDAYYGREVGALKELLSSLFRRAKSSYAELRDPEVRTPWVDHHIAEQAALKRMEEEQAEREKAASEMRRQADEAEAAIRREQRAQARARRQRERFQKRMLSQADRYRADAEQAEAQKNFARAANLYRLALRADPHNTLYKAKWEETRGIARKARAADAFTNAQTLLDMGKTEEATPLLVEAAEADPTAEHLAFAADAIRMHDKGRARDLAMSALDALQSSEARAKSEDEKKLKPRKPAKLGQLHLMIGRAFLAAGQKQTAKQQATLAQGYLPDDLEVRALLKACKAK